MVKQWPCKILRLFWRENGKRLFYQLFSNSSSHWPDQSVEFFLPLSAQQIATLDKINLENVKTLLKLYLFIIDLLCYFTLCNSSIAVSKIAQIAASVGLPMRRTMSALSTKAGSNACSRLEVHRMRTFGKLKMNGTKWEQREKGVGKRGPPILTQKRSSKGGGEGAFRVWGLDLNFLKQQRTRRIAKISFRLHWIN